LSAWSWYFPSNNIGQEAIKYDLRASEALLFNSILFMIQNQEGEKRHIFEDQVDFEVHIFHASSCF
jgi:hypothetical protein